jgi:hypothetical protein
MVDADRKSEVHAREETRLARRFSSFDSLLERPITGSVSLLGHSWSGPFKPLTQKATVGWWIYRAGDLKRKIEPKTDRLDFL